MLASPPRLMGAALRGGLSVPPSLYLGQIVTRTRVPNFRTNTGPVVNCTQINAQSAHFACDALQTIRVKIANWWVNTGSSGIQTGSGGTASITATMSRSDGTVIGIFTFSGSQTASVVNGGEVESDDCALSESLVIGNKYFYREFRNYAAGGNPVVSFGTTSGYTDTAIGDVFEAAVSGLSDKTQSGATITATHSSAYTYAPVAIVGMTRKASVFAFGDSICAGRGDTSDSTGDLGILCRALGAAGIPYINAGVPSDQVAWEQSASNIAGRLAASGYCSHIFGNSQTNDNFAGTAAATTQTNLGTLWGRFPAGKPKYWVTAVPRTTDATNTVVAAGEAARVANNDWLRGVPSGLTGYFETADVLESARNSGFWGNTAWEVDGTHPSQTGYLLVKNSGAINTAVFTR